MDSRKRRQIFVIGAMLALLTTLALLWQIIRSNDTARILQKGELVVAMDNSSFGCCKTDDGLAGFQYEIVKAFADSLDVKLKVKIINGIDKQINALQKHHCHLVAQLIPVTTCYRNVCYTQPLCLSRLVLLQRSDLPLTSHQQLAGKLITITGNAPYKMRINHLSTELADTIRLHTLPNLNDELLVQMVANSEIDYTIGIELLANKWNKQFTNLDSALPIGFSQHYAWAVNADSENLLLALNTFLEKFMQTVDHLQIYNTYFN